MRLEAPGTWPGCDPSALSRQVLRKRWHCSGNQLMTVTGSLQGEKGTGTLTWAGTLILLHISNFLESTCFK